MHLSGQVPLNPQEKDMNVPTGLDLWTADEVAECVDYGRHLTKEESDVLYGKLWGFLSDAENPTPLGGDGTAGTVEYPDARYSTENDDKAGHWWHKLSEREQEAIAKALDD